MANEIDIMMKKDQRVRIDGTTVGRLSRPGRAASPPTITMQIGWV